MPAGTIALTNNSTTVGGTGTAFTTELKAGDFIGVTVGGAPYTMIVASIASNTQLTIAQAYNGPTASGLAWYGVPATLKYAITQQVLNDMATNQRGMIAQLANWQKIYSDAASVTVERPDRSSFTGPSWGYMSAQYANKAAKGANSDITSLTGLTTALSVAQGGTGGKTQADARSGLGLADSATRPLVTGYVDALPNAVMVVGSYGVGSTTGPGGLFSRIDGGNGFYNGNGNTWGNPGGLTTTGCGVIQMPGNSAAFRTQLLTSDSLGGRIFVRSFDGSAPTTWKEAYTTANTTVDTNNFIKKASPIARLTNDATQMQPDFAVDDMHEIAGLVSVNDEAEGVSAEKLSTGVYQVTGAVGLADEGWTLEVPQDINGNRLCFVELATDKEGVITVSVFKRRFDVDSAMIVAGEPMDIPDGRWIDLRLQMPEDSAWNTRMREMEQAAEGDEATS
ncbi:hypothetical protein [Erwinia aphidicola]|uniref:phage tail fiber protein n=1 Tax=Erwinia aphidicola TaxID=68334 RepID=UPI00209DEBE5|nr:hypothetical protein [Erwinia aphidicola]MCP2232892.1 hypothetical protein [Erwinia aphidicola]